MTERLIFILSIICISTLSTFSQGIRGRITNSAGESIPYASVYVPSVSTGTVSNHEGNYELKLPEGKYNILFQYLGYQTVTREVTVGKTFQTTDITLSAQNFTISEIEVLASKEDPAWSIMRKAISMAPYYRQQVSKYSCKVYLKGTGVVENIPGLAKMMMKAKEIKQMQDPFVMETLSKIDFELPDKVNQQVLAMRSSGEQNSTSPMGMVTNSLYDADKYGVVSPVGTTALKMYNFKLEGVFEDQGRTINKIKVTPKSEGNDVFSGYIYIASNYWNIHSADLKMHVTMADINFHEVYAEVNKNTWMPVSLDFDIDFSGMGFKVKYKYIASITDYQTTLNPLLDHTFLEKIKNEHLEEMRIIKQINETNHQVANQTKEPSRQQKKITALMQKEEPNNREAAKLNKLVEKEIKRNSPPEPLEIKSGIKVSRKQVNNDSTYWAAQRPIPLTAIEKSSFVKKDSFLRVSATPRYKDSVRDSRQKFQVKHLIFGKTYNYSVDSNRMYENLKIPTLISPNSFSFNTVDGLRMDLPFNYYKIDSTGRDLVLRADIAYAFVRQKLDALFFYGQRFKGLKNTFLAASVGTSTQDFNRNTGISTLTNEFYTLFLEENYKKLYRRDFVQLSVNSDIANGLTLSETYEYSSNYALENHSTFTFIDDKNKVFTPNTPVNNSLESWQTGNHHSLIGRFVLDYTPHNRYRIRDGRKVYAGSKYPTFSLGYKSSFSGFLGNDSRFDILRLGIRQNIDYGFDNHFSYTVNAGKFLNSNHVYFEDFQHFNTQPTNLLFSSTENSFRLLPFYQFSTSDKFAEGHISFRTNRLILKWLPLIKKTSMSEALFANYLSTPGIKNYLETGYGFTNLFLFLSAEAVAGFENGTFRSAGIKVSINFK